MNRKTLKDISWQVSEQEYRQDKALSYSTLAKYERTGFNGLDKLFDKVESPSLLLGSCVDTLITGSMEDFTNLYVVVDLPEIPDSVLQVVKALYNKYKDQYESISLIPTSDIIDIAGTFNYQNNWKPETRAKVIIEKGYEYYDALGKADNKTIVSTAMYKDVLNCVDALHNSPDTGWYFQPNNPFEDIERYYQLKFKASLLKNIDYRCMFDELIVDYANKTIQPIDLKTSHKAEWDFYKSFIEWNYQIQNRLYVRILQEVISKDDYFKDFKILPYKDIVVCKDTLTPLVWDCPFTFNRGIVTVGKFNQIELRDPEVIGNELTHYLTDKPIAPINIHYNSSELKGNNLMYWLKKL